MTHPAINTRTSTTSTRAAAELLRQAAAALEASAAVGASSLLLGDMAQDVAIAVLDADSPRHQHRVALSVARAISSLARVGAFESDHHGFEEIMRRAESLVDIL